MLMLVLRQVVCCLRGSVEDVCGFSQHTTWYHMGCHVIEHDKRIPMICCMHILELWLWRYNHEKFGWFRKVPVEGTRRYRNGPDDTGRC